MSLKIENHGKELLIFPTQKQRPISSRPVPLEIHLSPPGTLDTKIKELTVEEIEELLNPFDEVEEEDGPLNPDYYSSDEE